MAGNRQKRKNSSITWCNNTNDSAQNMNEGLQDNEDKPDILSDYTTCEDIVEILDEINWEESSLSREYIEKRELKESIEWLTNNLKDSEIPDIDPNVQKINHHMMELAYLFDIAVQSGSELAAIAARAGMMNSRKIRSELFKIQKVFPKNFDRYMENCDKYLNCYVLYTYVCSQVDEIRDIIAKCKNALDEKQDQYEQTLADVSKNIKTDENLQKALITFKDQTYNQTSGMWSRELHDLFEKIVSLSIQRFNIDYETFLLKSEETKYHEKSAILQQLRATLKFSKPSPVVDLMENMEMVYRDVLDKSRKSEQEYTHMLETMEQLSEEMGQISG